MKILAANDDSYSLLIVQTCIDRFLNVSQTDTAQNGQVALDLVKNNENDLQ